MCLTNLPIFDAKLDWVGANLPRISNDHHQELLSSAPSTSLVFALPLIGAAALAEKVFASVRVPTSTQCHDDDFGASTLNQTSTVATSLHCQELVLRLSFVFCIPEQGSLTMSRPFNSSYLPSSGIHRISRTHSSSSQSAPAGILWHKDLKGKIIGSKHDNRPFLDAFCGTSLARKEGVRQQRVRHW